MKENDKCMKSVRQYVMKSAWRKWNDMKKNQQWNDNENEENQKWRRKKYEMKNIYNDEEWK